MGSTEYVFDTASELGHSQMDHLEALYDDWSARQLERTGVGPGQRCLGAAPAADPSRAGWPGGSLRAGPWWRSTSTPSTWPAGGVCGPSATTSTTACPPVGRST